MAIKKIFTLPSHDLDELEKQGAFADKEVAMMARMGRHRALVLFHGCGTLKNGQLFLVSEFMSGGDLRHALDKEVSGYNDCIMLCDFCMLTLVYDCIAF